VYGERGELIRERGLYMWGREFFEFIDTTVSEGGTYFYSLRIGEWGGEKQPILIGGKQQMTVSVTRV